MNRRNFIKKSLIAAGMVAVPAVAIEKVIAAPKDPAREYHLDICRELYKRWGDKNITQFLSTFYDQQQLAWFRLQNSIDKALWRDYYKRGPVRIIKTDEL